MTTVALLAPTDVGEKVTNTVQLAPAARLAGKVLAQVPPLRAN
jgi:hypothetical protein